MEVGKKYKILGEDNSFEKDQPNGTIVECLSYYHGRWFEVKLIDKCKRRLRKTIGGWIINCQKYNYEEIKYYNK